MPTLEALAERIAQLETSTGVLTTLGNQVDLVERQLQRLQGGGGALEPLSNISGWDLDDENVAASVPDNVTYVGMGQMLLAGAGITFSRPANTQFLKIVGGGGACYDYVVDSGGSGTHLTVRAMMADFIIEANATANLVRSCWICSDDSDSNIEWGSATSTAGTSTLSIEGSSTGNFLYSGVANSARHSLTGTGTAAHDGYFKTSLFYLPRLIFKNLRIADNAAATTRVSFIERKSTVGSADGPEILFDSCEFEMGTQTDFYHAAVCALVVDAATTGDNFEVFLHNCTGVLDGVFQTTAGKFTGGNIQLENCRMTIWSTIDSLLTVGDTGITTAIMDEFLVNNCSLTTSGPLIRNQSGSTSKFYIMNSSFRHLSASSQTWFVFQSGQTSGPTTIYISNIFYSQVSTSLGVIYLSAPSVSGGSHNFYVDSCLFLPDSTSSGTAIVTLEPGSGGGHLWDSGHIGDVSAPGFAAVASGPKAITTAALNMLIPGYLRVGSATVPTNVTAGDLTALRLNIGNVAFGTGADFQVSGDGILSGWLRVGAATAPTNITAGDLTIVRLNVGNVAFGTNVESVLGGDATLSGFLRIGSNTAPTNVTPGDLTALRMVIGDDATLSGTAGLYMRVAGTSTDTTSGAKIAFGAFAIIDPATAASGDFRVGYHQTIIPATNTADFTTRISGLLAEGARPRSGVNITANTLGGIIGVTGVGIVIESSTTDTGIITAAAGVVGVAVDRGSGTFTTKTLTTGRNFYCPDLATLSGFIITTLVGVDIDKLTRGVANVEFRNAGKMVYTPTAQTLSAATNTIVNTARIIDLDNSTGASLTLTSDPTISTTGAQDGQLITLTNVDSVDDIVLRDDSVVSSALRLPGAANLTLGPRDSVTFRYRSAATEWHCIASSNL